MMREYLLAQTDSRVIYHWSRLDALDQWWHWLAMAAVIGLLIAYIVYWYRRDWSEVPRPIGVGLLILRLSVFVGILIFFLDLQRRSEQRLVKPSRLAVLVDTSLSMSLPAQSDLSSSGQTRIGSVVDAFKNQPLLSELQANHDVTIYRFDQTARPTPVASLVRTRVDTSGTTGDSEQAYDVWRIASRVAWAGSILSAIGVILTAISLAARFWMPIRGARSWVPTTRRHQARDNPYSATQPSETPTPSGYGALAGIIAILTGIILIGVAVLRASDNTWFSLWQSQPTRVVPARDDVANAARPEPGARQTKPTEWNEQLLPSGTETRMGDAIKSILEQERGAPLAGIVLLTDGQSNSGLEPLATIESAILSNIPITAVGLGSAENPRNLRVVDVDAPKRVFPGDRFRITALIQSTGNQTATTNVQLRRRLAGQANTNLAIEEEVQVTLSDDEAMVPVQFDVLPHEIGNWIYDVKVIPTAEDVNPNDDSLDADVQVIEPKFKVLIIAGGPTREYQFVRNLLFRDKTIQSHVFLQTGGPGISQEAQKLLDDFPHTRQEMSEYDCVIAFDADWMQLEPSQIEVLERWVSEQAGGLVLIAGPVATPRWSGNEGNGDRRAELLRQLSPVLLNSRSTRLASLGRFEGEVAWPLEFSVDAKRMDFLSVANTPQDSAAVWNRFNGVYSFFACFDAKPGATPLAYFTDPATAYDGKKPIYLASHFFGAGRVIFQGSGEIWRLREIGDAYFDVYYTKLVRWCGQGRLLRDSDRGLLLLDKQQALVGEPIAIRAVMKDAQFQPLLVPSVEARIVDPGHRTSLSTLMPIDDPTQPGVYIGQFLAKQMGTYEVQLSVGGLADQIVLTQQVAVRVPAREVQRSERNDPLLREMANKTRGNYYVSLDTALQPNGKMSALASSVPAQDQIQFLPGAPDRTFQQRLMAMLMILMGTALSLEWLIRRLSKLA